MTDMQDPKPTAKPRSRGRTADLRRRPLAIGLLCALAAILAPGEAFCGDDCADLCGLDCACLDATVPGDCGCCFDTPAQVEIPAGAARAAGPALADPVDPPGGSPEAKSAALPPVPCSTPPWSARPAVLVLRS